MKAPETPLTDEAVIAKLHESLEQRLREFTHNAETEPACEDYIYADTVLDAIWPALRETLTRVTAERDKAVSELEDIDVNVFGNGPHDHGLCAHCGQKIGGGYSIINGKNYHPDPCSGSALQAENAALRAELEIWRGYRSVLAAHGFTLPGDVFRSPGIADAPPVAESETP
jgi:hypothetical protein